MVLINCISERFPLFPLQGYVRMGRDFQKLENCHLGTLKYLEQYTDNNYITNPKGIENGCSMQTVAL